VLVLLAGFAYAGFADLRDREVTDRLWQLMGGVGVVMGAAAVAPGGWIPVLLWVMVGLFTLQHLFPWDDLLGATVARYADPIEGVGYLAVILFVGVAVWRIGVGADQVPVPVLALLLTVLFARALFELGVLYGGADAKALMIAGVLVPVFASPLLPQSAEVATLLTVLPFSINLLMDAALISVAIPVGIGIRNALRGEFRFPRGFSGYMIPVRELPDSFVWLKDPLSGGDDDTPTAETSEEDRQERLRVARELEAKGVDRVWVTPQIPFLVLMAAGSVAALLAGNLVLDLLVHL
jgi:archaeal preflagellin peptidase FlaK